MFGKKRNRPVKDWDRENKRPVLRCSICNGEQVFGFRDIHSGSFEEIALIRSQGELAELAASYGISDIRSISKEY